ncbi:unnamed protein product [Gordionus sp. m RMFG-2023]
MVILYNEITIFSAFHINKFYKPSYTNISQDIFEKLQKHKRKRSILYEKNNLTDDFNYGKYLSFQEILDIQRGQDVRHESSYSQASRHYLSKVMSNYNIDLVNQNITCKNMTKLDDFEVFLRLKKMEWIQTTTSNTLTTKNLLQKYLEFFKSENLKDNDTLMPSSYGNKPIHTWPWDDAHRPYDKNIADKNSNIYKDIYSNIISYQDHINLNMINKETMNNPNSHKFQQMENQENDFKPAMLQILRNDTITISSLTFTTMADDGDNNSNNRDFVMNFKLNLKSRKENKFLVDLLKFISIDKDITDIKALDLHNTFEKSKENNITKLS